MEHGDTERLERIGQAILAAARDELYLGMRFLDVALSSFEYQMNTEISPFGTDGSTIYFQPREMGGLYKQNRILVNRGYLHMVYHCLFRHMLKIIPKQEENFRYWNLACDIAAEHLIDSNDQRFVRLSRSLLRREMYRKLEAEADRGAADGLGGVQSVGGSGKRYRKRVLNAERIYRELLAWQLSEKELLQLESEFYVDDHRYWGNQGSEKKAPNPELNQKWQDINEQIETDLETFSKEASEKNGDLLGQLVVENRKKQDYREFLRKFSVIREEPEVDTDTFDYIFYSYGLSLYGNMPLIEPQETKEVKKVRDFVVAIDTSMSCSGETVRRFLETTYAVLNERDSFFKKVNVHIIQCDENVQSDVKITCEKELQTYMKTFTLYGEGGTDFRPVFAYVEELINEGEFEDLRGLIYFTDGFGTYPKQMPAYQTAFVFSEEDYADAEVPAWAIKAVLETGH